MSRGHIYIVGAGLVSPAGVGMQPSWEALCRGERFINELSLFPGSPRGNLPVAEVTGLDLDQDVPRTHELARLAAAEALSQASPFFQEPLDAIVVGGTTGGMPVTELLIRDDVKDPRRYRWHGAGTVAEYLAATFGCRGQILSLATACSSGAVALKVALELLRTSQARTVLAGGVDALCRLTYHGFSMLKVIDANGARPLDEAREGMTVGEGAAMVLLMAADSPPNRALAILRGGGLSCDAYHPSSPHPEGRGALAAMQKALRDAQATVEEIDLIHLHGTGTKDNDASEAKGLRALFDGQDRLPHHSSIKGSLGHAVGAAGAVGAVVASLALRDGIVPGNTGCRTVDPALNLTPILEPSSVPEMKTALANAFGFGGNNATLLLSRPDSVAPTCPRREPITRFALLGASCITGAGHTQESLVALENGKSLAGVLEEKTLTRALAPRRIRRIKRLPRIALALVAEMGEDGKPPQGIGSLFLGTAWGALSETYDFLKRLFESNETVSSPTDFVGTVHNAVTGQVATWLDARGANVTTTTGDASFTDALRLATLLPPEPDEGTIVVIGAEEAHPILTHRLDPPPQEEPLADGGGALILEPATAGEKRMTVEPYFMDGSSDQGVIDDLLEEMGGTEDVSTRIGALWYGFSENERAVALTQLEVLDEVFGDHVLRLDYRKHMGHFAGASAVATALAAIALECESPLIPAGKGALIITLGCEVTALELRRNIAAD